MIPLRAYKTLSLPPNSTSAKIKSAYRRLAFKYHPDHQNGTITDSAMFIKIKEAYDVLKQLKTNRIDVHIRLNVINCYRLVKNQIKKDLTILKIFV